VNAFLGRLSQLTGAEVRLLQTIALIVVLIALRWAILLVVRRRTEDIRTRYYWRKAVTYTVGVLATFLITRLWFEGIGSIATFLGLIGAGIAVALKDPLTNLAGWLFILWRRPFRVGDRVQIGKDAGDVIDLRLFQFTLNEIGNWVDADQSTGRLVHVPNSLVFNTPLANYTRGFNYLWNEVPVLVTFESNWKAAKQILHEIATRHSEKFSASAERDVLAASRQFMIFYSTLKPIVYTTVKDSGILLTIRHLCEVRGRRGSAEAIWEEILEAFAKTPDIDLAYPTTRFYTHPVEGKPALKPPEPSA
jgi:small-conductance mechanosensitive channel